MKTQSDITTEITNLIREWDYQGMYKLSHRDLAIKIEDIYLKYYDFVIKKEYEK